MLSKYAHLTGTALSKQQLDMSLTGVFQPALYPLTGYPLTTFLNLLTKNFLRSAPRKIILFWGAFKTQYASGLECHSLSLTHSGLSFCCCAPPLQRHGVRMRIELKQHQLVLLGFYTAENRVLYYDI